MISISNEGRIFMQPDIVAYKLIMALGMIAVIVIPVCIIAQTRVRAFVGFRERI